MPAILLTNGRILIGVCSYIYLAMRFVYMSVFGNLIIRLAPLAFTIICRIIQRKCDEVLLIQTFGINLVGFFRALLMSYAAGQLVSYGKLPKNVSLM